MGPEEKTMLTYEENELLTRVTSDAPMAQLMRQHWTPVCLLEEVDEPDGKPLRVEVLGESYVAFRDTKGRLGMLDELCPTLVTQQPSCFLPRRTL